MPLEKRQDAAAAKLLRLNLNVEEVAGTLHVSSIDIDLFKRGMGHGPLETQRWLLSTDWADELSDALGAELDRRGFSENRAVERAGLARSTLWRWRKRKSEGMTVDSLLRLCAAAEIDPVLLFAQVGERLDYVRR